MKTSTRFFFGFFFFLQVLQEAHLLQCYSGSSLNPLTIQMTVVNCTFPHDDKICLAYRQTFIATNDSLYGFGCILTDKKGEPKCKTEKYGQIRIDDRCCCTTLLCNNFGFAQECLKNATEKATAKAKLDKSKSFSRKLSVDGAALPFIIATIICNMYFQS